MASKPARKPKNITAQSITLLDTTGKPRIVMDAWGEDVYAHICLFAKDGKSIQISTQPNGALVIALQGKRCGATLSLDAGGDGGLSIRDREGLLGTMLGSILVPGQHGLTLFHGGQPYWSSPEPPKQKKKKRSSINVAR
jgi:hypothetical protein